MINGDLLMSEQQPNINKEQSVASCCPDETGSDPRANTQTRPHTELSGKVFRIFAYNDPDAENQYQKIMGLPQIEWVIYP